jgi:hypothetical protein
MEALTPREIQARIRSGESLAAVTAVAGLDPERVEAFASPVLAERTHIAASALASPLRKTGETASTRGLRQVVAERLLGLGLDIDIVEWDAWRRSDGRWIAEGRYESADTEHIARFLFDNRSRFSVPENDEARRLIGDPTPVASHRPGRRRALDDQDSEPTVDLAEPEPSSRPALHPVVTPSWVDVPTDLLGDDEPDSLAPGHRSALDTLYNMISVIEEDSVKIYRGLREPLPGIEADPRAEPDVEVEVEEPIPLLEVPEPTPEPASPPRRRGGRRQRASVPSWDEIMFGGPPAS